MKKILALLLVSASVLLLFAVVQALVFAKFDSIFWQYRLMIGILFMVVTRFAVMAYRRSRIGHS